MAENESPKTLPTTQITTSDINAPPPGAPTVGNIYPGTMPANPGVAPNAPPGAVDPNLARGSNAAPELYPPGTAPDPVGTAPGGDETVDPTKNVGVEGEQVVWEGRYSIKNFAGRIAFRVLLIALWIALAVYAWGGETKRATWVGMGTIILGIVLLILCLQLAYRIVMALYGHFYRVTTRRLFVSTGVFQRRRDQVELLQVHDVYTKQTLTQRWLDVGTVIVESSEERYPLTYLTGVEDPKGVHDLIWHHARAERDERSVKVDQI